MHLFFAPESKASVIVQRFHHVSWLCSAQFHHWFLCRESPPPQTEPLRICWITFPIISGFSLRFWIRVDGASRCVGTLQIPSFVF